MLETDGQSYICMYIERILEEIVKELNSCQHKRTFCYFINWMYHIGSITFSKGDNVLRCTLISQIHSIVGLER